MLSGGVYERRVRVEVVDAKELQKLDEECRRGRDGAAVGAIVDIHGAEQVLQASGSRAV